MVLMQSTQAPLCVLIHMDMGLKSLVYLHYHLLLISLGIIGGKGFGVNHLVNLIDVRVVAANGFARTDNIIAGLDFAVGVLLRELSFSPI